MALASSACWGVADFAGGLFSRRLPAAVVLLAQQIAGAVICAALILGTAEALPEGRTVWLSLLAGSAGALALGAFYRALALGTMSVVAPISASGVVVPVIVGIASGDRPTALQAAAIPVIFAGVLLASREVHEHEERVGAARTSILLALFAALAFGVYFSITDAVAEDSVLWLLLIGRGAAVALLAGFVVARPPAVRPKPVDLLPLAAIGGLDLLATGLYALATTEGLLSIVAVVGSLYPIATVLLARAVLRERLRRGQQAGVALALVGVAAVAAG
ncbi:MAG TPA: EamA family transporter [Solirubrobacteraceae bacterium]|nr:EamA family transporter [Solirubrobacteraceae bacterium]